MATQSRFIVVLIGLSQSRVNPCIMPTNDVIAVIKLEWPWTQGLEDSELNMHQQ